MDISLVILAAGVGSRYGGLKQLQPIGPKDERLIEYSIYDANRAGVKRVILVIRQEIASHFEAVIGRKLRGEISVEYAYQELNILPDNFYPPANRTKPWGTAQALLTVRSLINEPFIVINGDDFYGRKSYQLLSNYLSTVEPSSATTYAMIGFTLIDTLPEEGSVSRAIGQCDEKGFLQNLREYTRVEKVGEQVRYVDEHGEGHNLSGSELVSMNIWGFTPTIFPRLENKFISFLHQYKDDTQAEFRLPTAINELIADSQIRVKVLPHSFAPFGVTYSRDQLWVAERLKSLIKQGEYPANLWA